jgi:hypothetical protein
MGVDHRESVCATYPRPLAGGTFLGRPFVPQDDRADDGLDKKERRLSATHDGFVAVASDDPTILAVKHLQPHPRRGAVRGVLPRRVGGAATTNVGGRCASVPEVHVQDARDGAPARGATRRRPARGG